MNHPNAVGNEDYTGFYDSDLGQSVVYGFKKIYIPEIFGEVERFLPVSYTHLTLPTKA